jgi:ribosomal protein S18
VKLSYTDANSVYPQNFSIMSEYVSEMGRIKPGTVTGLRPVNQRRVAKAIRRAIGLGLMPSVHRHPEILVAEERQKAERRASTRLNQTIDSIERR